MFGVRPRCANASFRRGRQIPRHHRHPGIASDQARRLLTTRLKYSAAKPIPMPAETGSLADRAAIRAELAWPLGMAIHRLRAHRLEACSDLLDEDFGFLPGGEVPTL